MLGHSTPLRATLVLLTLLATSFAGCLTPGAVTESNDTPTPTPPTDPLDSSTPDAVPVPVPVPVGCGAAVASPDSDGDKLTDREEAFWGTDPASPDSDKDGLGDGDEIAARTYPFTAAQIQDKDADHDAIPDGAELCIVYSDPRSYSSDGDRYGDGLEFFGTFLSGYHDANPYAINDLPSFVKGGVHNPDVPDITIAVSEPRVKLAKAITVSGTTVEAKEHAKDMTSSVEATWNQGYTFETGVEVRAGLGIQNKGAEGPGFRAHASVEAHAAFEFHLGYEFTATMASTETFAGVSRQEWQNAEITNIGDASGPSTLEANLQVKNIGNDLLRSGIADIAVNFYLGDQLIPGGTWTLTSSDRQYSLNQILPGQTVTLGLVSLPLDAATFKAFASGTPIHARIEHYSFGDDQQFLMNVKGRTAQVDVDDGKGPVARRYVQVPETGMSVVDAYNTFGRMEVGEVEGFKSIVSVDGKKISTDPTTPPYRQWRAYITDIRTNEIPKNITDVKVYRGSTVLLTYDADTDGDAVSDRYEERLGTSAQKADTDGDGLTDGEEVLGWLGAENETFYTNALVKDTDKDGIPDLQDPDPVNRPGDALDEIIIKRGPDLLIYGRIPNGSLANVRTISDPDINWTIGDNRNNPVFIVTADLFGDSKQEIIVHHHEQCLVYDAHLGKRLLSFKCGGNAPIAWSVDIVAGRFLAGHPKDVLVTWDRDPNPQDSKCVVWRVEADDRGNPAPARALAFPCADTDFYQTALIRWPTPEGEKIFVASGYANRCSTLDVNARKITHRTDTECWFNNQAVMGAIGNVRGDEKPELVILQDSDHHATNPECIVVSNPEQAFRTSQVEWWECTPNYYPGVHWAMGIANLNPLTEANIVACGVWFPEGPGCAKYVGQTQVRLDVPWIPEGWHDGYWENRGGYAMGVGEVF